MMIFVKLFSAYEQGSIELFSYLPKPVNRGCVIDLGVCVNKYVYTLCVPKVFNLKFR